MLTPEAFLAHNLPCFHPEFVTKVLFPAKYILSATGSLQPQEYCTLRTLLLSPSFEWIWDPVFSLDVLVVLIHSKPEARALGTEN